MKHAGRRRGRRGTVVMWDAVAEVGEGSRLYRTTWMLVYSLHPCSPVLLTHCSVLGREVLLK